MCEPIRDANGNVTVIVCGGRHKRKYCRWCGSYADLLCDFPVRPGHTCDAPICAKHAKPMGANLDYCPKHAQEQRRRPVAQQQSLFGGLSG